MSTLDDIIEAHHTQAGREAGKIARCRRTYHRDVFQPSPYPDWLDDCRKEGRRITTRVERRLIRLEREAYPKRRARKMETPYA